MLARLVVCGALLCLSCSSAMSADKVNLKGKMLPGLISPQLMPPDIQYSDPRLKLQVFKNEGLLGKEFASQLGLTAQDGYIKEEKTDATTGVTIFHLNQTFKGVPIWGQRIIASGKDFTVRTGYQFTGIEKDIDSIVPRLSPAEAMAKAKEAVAGSRVPELTFENERNELVIYIRPTDKRAKLSYNVSFFTVLNKDGSGATRPMFLIDANNSEILLRYEGLARGQGLGPGGNVRTGQYLYGPPGQFPGLDVEVDAGTCHMKSPKVTTVDLQSQITAASVPFKFPCFTNKHKQVNGAFSPINDAHYFANTVYRMFHDWYNIDLLNVLRPKDAPHLKALEIRVHYGIGVENAYWQGNAALFGDGGQKYYPMVSLDFVGHEIGHGYTEYTSNLQPGGQPGAIAEAFSDMAGETAESYAKNGAEPDFLVAPSLVKEAGAMRYICDPKRDMKSIHHASEYTSGMDPHYAAGIFNRAFCLLAKTPGWNVRKAFHVFLNAQKGGWNLFSDFAEAAEVAVEVADQDLGFNPADVRNAFVAVGVL